MQPFFSSYKNNNSSQERVPFFRCLLVDLNYQAICIEKKKTALKNKLWSTIHHSLLLHQNIIAVIIMEYYLRQYLINVVFIEIQSTDYNIHISQNHVDNYRAWQTLFFILSKGSFIIPVLSCTKNFLKVTFL